MDFGPVFRYFNQFLYGVGMTIGLSAASIFIGATLGFLMCLARMSRHKWLNMPAKAYISVVRGTPTLIQLYIFAFGIPMLLQTIFMRSITIDFTVSGIIALGLNSTAYSAEIYRSGVQAVDVGQFEAATSMGFSYRYTMRKIIFPQAFRNILPSIGGEFITVVKESSIVSVLGIYDITGVANIVKANTLKVFETLILAAGLYFAITFTLSKLINLLEKRFNVYATR
ncbi:MAG: amino acid ABC transporter permease [Bacilli bacterium]|jgi:polar amino acid transport system permease protein|nr:amino acid ABC transporter permease [Bacilli bacterium]